MIVKDVLDAIRRNGWPKIKNYYFEIVTDSTVYGQSTRKTNYLGAFNKGATPQITGACAFGQASLNLGVRIPQYNGVPEYFLDTEFGKALNDIPTPVFGNLDTELQTWDGYIRYLNDQTSMSLKEIADEVESLLPSEALTRELNIQT